MTPAASPKAQGAGGRWFAHRLFGLCGAGGACPPAASSPFAAQPATPGWRAAVPGPMKAA